MIPFQTIRQRDFSGGEVDPEAARRDDSELVRAAGRQMSNKRVTPSGAMGQRPGRRALFVFFGRTDQVRISESEFYYICFGHDGELFVQDQDGTALYSSTGYPWTDATVDQVVWDRFDKQVIVCFPGMRPKVLTLSNGAWTAADFAEDVRASGQKRTPFYRFSPEGITLTPSDVTGSVSIAFSEDLLTDDHVGTRIRYQGRQLTITAITNQRNGTATVNERLFPTQRLTATVDPASQFSLGDEVEADPGGAKGIVAASGVVAYSVSSMTVNAGGSGFNVGDTVQVVGGTGNEATASVDTVGGGGAIDSLTITSAGNYTVAPTSPANLAALTGAGTGASVNLVMTGSAQTLDVVLASATLFEATDTVVGPNGKSELSAVATISPGATTVWDEEVMNAMRGWPRSVFVDQNRLGFTDFPGLGRAVAWSGIDTPFDLYPGSDPDAAMMELLKGVGRVYHVVPGDDEFVFSDTGVFYIPISETNPLKPGSVTFRLVTTLAAAQVRPVTSPEGLAFIDAGGNRVIGIRPTGQVTKPYLARSISDLHSHLITGPVALASGADDPTTTERYVYVLNADGSIAVGRYDPNKDWVGWLPWTAGGSGLFKWVSGARGGGAVFTTFYPLGGSPINLVEILDADALLDGQILVNDVPSGLAPPGGKGPLWVLAGGTVTLMDGNYPMDTRAVDADGNIVAIESEDLSSADLVAGFAWQETFEPFVPHVAAGNGAKQTLRRRKFGRIGIHAKHRSGYVCANRRIPTWRLGDDMTVAPPERDGVEFFRKLGRSVDPTFELVKDIPGEMVVSEVSFEVTV